MGCAILCVELSFDIQRFEFGTVIVQFDKLRQNLISIATHTSAMCMCVMIVDQNMFICFETWQIKVLPTSSITQAYRIEVRYLSLYVKN